jgi:hypothetical protein
MRRKRLIRTVQGLRNPHKNASTNGPLLFGERVRVRGICGSGGEFRSPYVPCFSVATEPVNVPGRLTATAATRAPGKRSAAGGKEYYGDNIILR